MIEWYISKMEESHKDKRWEDRLNYARMANVDFLKYLYLKSNQIRDFGHVFFLAMYYDVSTYSNEDTQ